MKNFTKTLLFAGLFVLQKNMAAQTGAGWRLTQKYTQRTETFFKGDQLKVERPVGKGMYTYEGLLVDWTADTLRLIDRSGRPEAFLPMQQVQSVMWEAPNQKANKQRQIGIAALVGGLGLLAAGAVVDFNDNFCIDFGTNSCSGADNPRGGFIAFGGAAVAVYGIVSLSSARKKRVYKLDNVGSDWMVAPLRATR